MFYVNMLDKFMSGWGLAETGRSLLCIACETLEQAEAIEAAARKRPEMRYIAIANRPRRHMAGDQRTIKHFSQLGGPWLEFYRSAKEGGR